MAKRRTIALPAQFVDDCEKKSIESCRPLTWYIQYAVKEFWKTEEHKKSEVKEK